MPTDPSDPLWMAGLFFTPTPWIPTKPLLSRFERPNRGETCPGTGAVGKRLPESPRAPERGLQGNHEADPLADSDTGNIRPQALDHPNPLLNQKSAALIGILPMRRTAVTLGEVIEPTGGSW